MPETPGHAAKYRTIVVDPPWPYNKTWPIGRPPKGVQHDGRRNPLPYAEMPIAAIEALPVRDLVAKDAHLYLWATSRFLEPAYVVARSWGFRVSVPLVWVKTPMPNIYGGTFAPSAEFILFCRRGSLAATLRVDRQWWHWPRSTRHSQKPDAFLDLVETVSPGPYLELFARRQRLGWDTWGDEVLNHVGRLVDTA